MHNKGLVQGMGLRGKLDNAEDGAVFGNQILTSHSISANGMRDIWKESSFGNGNEKQRYSDYQGPFKAPLAVASVEN